MTDPGLSEAESVLAGLTDYREGDIVRHKNGQYAVVHVWGDCYVKRIGWMLASWIRCEHWADWRHSRGYVCKLCSPLHSAKHTRQQLSWPVQIKRANVRLWRRL
jgi:hypothetical protein